MRKNPWPSDPRSYLWLIDGHNAIFAHPELEALQVEGNRGEARRRLEAIVVRFATLHGVAAVIVYDGNRMERNPDATQLGNVKTVYSAGPDEEADDRIVWLAVAALREGGKVAVVTSDRATLAARLPREVRVVRPSELFRRSRPPRREDSRSRPDGDFSDIERYFLSLAPERPPTRFAQPDPPASPAPPARPAPPAPSPQPPPPRNRPSSKPPEPCEAPALEADRAARRARKKLRGERAQSRRLASYKKRPAGGRSAGSAGADRSGV